VNENKPGYLGDSSNIEVGLWSWGGARQPPQMASWSKLAQAQRETWPHSAHKDSICFRVENASKNCVLFGADQCRHTWGRPCHEWIFPFSNHCRKV